MRIGLDARKLWDGGIGTYIRFLLGAMVARPVDFTFAALLDPGDLGRVRWPEGPLREIPVRARKYGIDEHWVIPRAARHAGVDLLHAPHYTLPLGWGGPSVVTIHDLIHLRFPHYFPPGGALYARAMAGAAAWRAGLVLVNSSDTQGDVVRLLRVPERKVRVTPLGVAPTIRRQPSERVGVFRAARRLPADYVLYVGARKPHKNLALLLRALASLPADARPPLVLSGDRWSENRPLARLVRDLGIVTTVHFAGDLTDHGDLSCLYSGAILYAQPSQIEGFGLPVLEAMACGVPVLASEGVPREVGGEAALWLPLMRPDAWATAIADCLDDAERRTIMAARGLEHVRAFTWDRTATLTMAAYREVMV